MDGMRIWVRHMIEIEVPRSFPYKWVLQKANNAFKQKAGGFTI